MPQQKPEFARNSGVQNLIATMIAPKFSLSHPITRRFQWPIAPGKAELSQVPAQEGWLRVI